MATLNQTSVQQLLQPYLLDTAVPTDLFSQLLTYLELLVKWNQRTNLTAIRQPEQMVLRHFGESLFAGRHLPSTAQTLLDFGSGAGFPGLPMQLLHPEIKVTLSESQGKKASFLREVVRSLGLQTEVWSARVETMPHERNFDVVTLRAVDKMEEARRAALRRVAPGGVLMVLASGDLGGIPIPTSHHSTLTLISC